MQGRVYVNEYVSLCGASVSLHTYKLAHPHTEFKDDC